MARLPPPCHPLYCRLRLFDRRTRRHPPLRTTFLLAALGICHSRRLPTQRRCRSDPNGTSPTRSQQSEGASSSRSPGPSQDALAAIRRSARRQEFPITDAVRLTRYNSIINSSFSTCFTRSRPNLSAGETWSGLIGPEFWSRTLAPSGRIVAERTVSADILEPDGDSIAVRDLLHYHTRVIRS